MKWIEVIKSKPLQGKITVPGSKNSSLGLLAASCLASEPVILKNIPDILDFRTILEIARDIGLKICVGQNCIIVDPTKINSAVIDSKKSAAFRASYYFIGALLAKFKRVTIGKPGGDNFNSRPIDQHIKGLKTLGAKIEFFNDYYYVEADKLIGKDIFFNIPSTGATINLLLTAVLAEGTTILHNSARDPEVTDVAIFLTKMGARISGIGTSTITIEGVKELHGCTHYAIPDRLTAGAFLMSAGITDGVVTVNNIIPEHLSACTNKLIASGLGIEIGDDYITAFSQGPLMGINVKTENYPGFGTDFQQPLTAMLTKSKSMSTIIDNIFPERFNNCYQLNRMGANITVSKGHIVIPGNSNLIGGTVDASDVRAGVCLILAGLVADGVTRITGVEHIERGYEDVIRDFSSLGANLKLREDTDAIDLQLQKVANYRSAE